MSDNIKIFEVGGSIRNELLGLKPNDRDFTVLAPNYEAMKQHLLERGATIYQERPQYVNIKAKFPMEKGSVDFTLARKESFYTDGRHPDSVTPAETIEQDLARRDFTCNAIAREVGTQTLIDPFNGIDDIESKVIRSVGVAKDRFTEDKLRIFRALRFSVTLNFYTHPNVRAAIGYFTPDDFEAISPERIQVELGKMFEADTQEAFHTLASYPYLLEVMAKKGVGLKATILPKK